MTQSQYSDPIVIDRYNPCENCAGWDNIHYNNIRYRLFEVDLDGDRQPMTLQQWVERTMIPLKNLLGVFDLVVNEGVCAQPIDDRFMAEIGGRLTYVLQGMVGRGDLSVFFVDTSRERVNTADLIGKNNIGANVLLAEPNPSARFMPDKRWYKTRYLVEMRAH